MQAVLNFNLNPQYQPIVDERSRGELTAYQHTPEAGAAELFVRDSCGALAQASMQQILTAASELLESQFKEVPLDMSSPNNVKTFLKTKLYGLEHEVFAIMYLDSQLRLIKYETLFRGTISQAPVYPREVLKECLVNNAAAVIIAHNHPSGVAEPSTADIRLTQEVKKLLIQADVKTMDHIIIGGSDAYSMAEKGQL